MKNEDECEWWGGDHGGQTLPSMCVGGKSFGCFNKREEWNNIMECFLDNAKPFTVGKNRQVVKFQGSTHLHGGADNTLPTSLYRYYFVLMVHDGEELLGMRSLLLLFNPLAFLFFSSFRNQR